MKPLNFSFSKKLASIVAGIAFVPLTAAVADVFDYTTGTFTETFDNLGEAGLATTSLTGVNSLPNDGASPWFVGIVASGTGNTAATITTTALQFVSTGSEPVVNGTARLFNNGEAGTNAITDRAIGTGNTGGDPVIDLKIKNSGGSISNFTISFDTEYWRSGTSTTAANLGYLLYYSTTGLANSWVPITYTRATKVYATATSDLDGNLAANRVASGNITVTLPLPLPKNSTFYLRFRDDNDATHSPDANIAIDNFTFTANVLGEALTYNLAHTAGGAPNGTWDTAGGLIFLNGAAPASFAANDFVNFLQDGTATIDVPAAIAPGFTNVAHASGNYTIGGAGTIAGPLAKSGAGTLTLSSANAFTATSLSGGGTIVTQNGTALGTGGLNVGTGGGILETTSDLTIAGGTAGAGALSKTGPGTLIFAGTGTGTGLITVSAGNIQLNAVAALGGQGVTMGASGTSFIVNAGAADQAMGARILTTEPGGNTITVTQPAQNVALAFGTANTLVGVGPLIKNGPGVLRSTVAHAGLTSNWTINEGTLEVNGVAANLGSGSIAVNSTGTLVAAGGVATPVANSVTLAGGALGTRSGDLALFSGAVQVTAASGINLKSNSTPTGVASFSITGILSGSSNLTINGNIPLTAGGGKSLILKNNNNTYSGTIFVTSQQGLMSDSLLGSGSCFGSATIKLQGGTLRLRDANNATYANQVHIEDPTSLTLPGIATIDVDRPATNTTSTNNILDVNVTTIGNHTLATTGANGYQVRVGNLALSGSPTFSPTTAPLIITGALTGAFDITKEGTGILTLSGANTYTGITNVKAGTLVLSGSVAGTSKISVLTGATVDVSPLVAPGLTVGATQVLSGNGTVVGSVVVANGSKVEAENVGATALSVEKLTFGTTAGNTATVNVNLSGATPGKLVVSAADGLTAAGGTNTVTINANGNNMAPGTYTLIDYSGTIQGTGYAAFVLGALPSRATGHLEHNIANTSIDLIIDTVDSPIWTGLTSTEWSTATIAGAKNWKLSIAGTATDFLSGEVATFTDFPAANQTVNIPADISVANLIFTNNTIDYAFTGTNAITGVGGLTKSGAGKVTLGTTNSFSGAVTLNGGTVIIPVIANSGTNSSIGTSNTITMAGGGIEFSGVGGVSNRAIVVNAGGGSVGTSVGADLTLSGAFTLNDALSIVSEGSTTISSVLTGATASLAVSGAGTTKLTGNVTTTGAITKTGAGTLTMTGAANTPGSYTISAGTLQFGDGTVGSSTGTGTITNNATLLFNNQAANTLIAGNEIVGTGVLNKIGAGTVTLNGAVANTFSGVTTVSGGTLVLSKTSGIDAIGGNLVVETGGTVAYGTTAGQLQDHIPDTASITINGGTFGSGAGSTLIAPTASVTDTVASVTINSGTFLSGRNSLVTPFTITGALTANGGTLLIQRGGGLNANSVTLASGVIFDMDGGSGTAGQTSKFIVGSGGLNLQGVTINMNNGPSAVAAGSAGSVITLGGNVTTTGTNVIQRKLPLVAGPKAEIDLGAATRTFDVTGNLAIGTGTEPIFFFGGAGAGITKAGLGTLDITGVNTYSGDTIVEAGKMTLNGTINNTPTIDVKAGATLQVLTATGLNLQPAQTLTGSGTVDATNVGLSGETSGKITPGTASTVGTLTIKTGTANLNLANVVAVGDSLALTYDLDTIAASDKVVLADGILDVGTGVLDIGDFAFTTLPGFNDGTYTLIQTNQPIVGTLAANVTATIGGKSAILAKGDGGTDIVLIVGGSLTDLQNWRQTYFGTTDNTGDAANTFDKDGDGLANILEYLLGSNPTLSGEFGDVSVSQVGSNLVLKYSRKKAALAEVTPQVETSTSLQTGTWVTTGVTTTIISDDNVTQVVEASVAIGDPNEKRFLRLRATTP